MHSLVVLLMATAATSAAVRPSGTGPTSPAPSLLVPQPQFQPAIRPPSRKYLNDYFYNRFAFPQYAGYDNAPRMGPVVLPDHEWLNKEIDRLNQMEDEEDSPTTYEVDLTRWIAQDHVLRRMFENARMQMQEMPNYEAPPVGLIQRNLQFQRPHALFAPDRLTKQVHHEMKKDHSGPDANSMGTKQKFALTPNDKGYFDAKNEEKYTLLPNEENAMHEGGNLKAAILMEPPRQIRQNPNLSRTKTLVAENLDRLRNGLSHEEGQPTDKPDHVHILEAAKDPAESIFGVALISAIGVAITMALFGFAIGWYTMFKKAKAAEDVDYPAYGVTGPNIDTSGDRKLAHSAHMYHYQHQKQQIIAMERNGLEQRNGSISDPESEEENEEGDYTVYECPGFATTGDMEVKNPLFNEDPTPATPGKCEVVKPQPKD